MKKSILSRTALIFGLLMPALSAAAPFDNIYILGDSLSDQGNLYAATLPGTPASVPCDLSQPSCQNLVTANPQTGVPANDHYYQGRFSNGPNYVDILAQDLGLPDSTPSSSGGNNFAYGGARTNYNVAEITAPIPNHGFYPQGGAPWSLQLEQQAFEASNISDPNGLYIVWSGSNDIGDIPTLLALGQLKPQDIPATLNNVVQGIEGVINAFKAAGAQDILVPNIPDLGLTPGVLTQPPQVRQFVTSLASTYNTLLDAMLNTVVGVNIIRFDVFSLVQQVNANPSAYGFTNVTDACYSGFVQPDINHTQTVCSTPDSYAFWDIEHPTTAFNAFLADRFFQAVVPASSSLVNFLLGLGVLMVLGKTGLLRRDKGVDTPLAG